MQLRTLIVDDEAPARERLKRLLADIAGIEIIGEAEDGRQAVELIEQGRPELVFLDVQMPGLDGFEVLESLDRLPQVVFVTAYDEYAIRAFEVNALDYLLKPFSRERLAQAVQRALEARDKERELTARIRPLLETMAAQERYLERLAVHDGERIRVLDADEIDWIDVDDEDVRVHVGEHSYRVRRTLSELAARLDPVRFFQAHRSAIVNLDRVQEVIPWFKGSHKLRLISGQDIDLSRARAKALRQRLQW